MGLGSGPFGGGPFGGGPAGDVVTEGAIEFMTNIAVGGFSRKQIIEIVNKRTERKAKDGLDLDSEFLIALQEFCWERRWWWRRRLSQFTLVPGTSTYDVTDPTGINAPDMQQISRNGAKVFPLPTNGSPLTSAWQPSCQYHPLDPIFDPDQQDTIIQLQSSYAQGTPQRFFFVPGNPWEIQLDPIPDAAYPFTLSFYAVPNWTADSVPEQVPLVPAYLHPVLIKKFERTVLRYTIGEESAKYQAVSEEYEESLEKAQLYGNFSDGQISQIKIHDSEDSVRST